MADEKTEIKEVKAEETKKDSKGLPKAVKIGLGCLIILAILVVLGGAVFATVIKRFLPGVLQSAIEQKTGVKTDIKDLEKGQFTFTDPKTGAKVDVGSGTIPENFPKDFPIYPGSKVTSSLSGDGFWLTLSTPDAPDKVAAYYETALKANGWSTESSTAQTGGTNLVVKKDKLNGYLTVAKENDANETTILIVLGESKASASPSPSGQ